MNHLYVTRGDDKDGLRAIYCLMHLGCDVRTLIGREQLFDTAIDDDTVIVALFTSPGNYPSSHLRMLTLGDVEKRHFVVPIWARNARIQVALKNRSPQNDKEGTDPRFREALRHIYESLAHPKGFTRRKKQLVIKPRSEWKSGFHARLRREKSNHPGFVSGGWGDSS